MFMVLNGLLALLAADDLVGIADTLALVRLRLLERADHSGELPDLLGIDARDGDDVLLRGDLEALRDGDGHRVREAERHDEVLALDVGLEADALDDELLLV